MTWILELVGYQLSIPVSEICGSSRKQEIVDARAIVIAVWRRQCPEIPQARMAEALRRDKSCVVNLRRTFRARLRGREGFRRKWALVEAALADLETAHAT